MDGFFDIQVNGYGGVDFNSDGLSPEDLHKACRVLRNDGVAGILATIITDDIDIMCARIARIAELRESDSLAKEIIAGIHIEGPFLNKTRGYCGAHPTDAIKPADVEAAKKLLDSAAGLTKIFTLAPENDADLKLTRFLADQGILVSAGHCDPSIDRLKAAIDAGLSMFTHLGNGCPMEMNRHDNIIQRVLSIADKLWICFIADGVHIPFFALKNYIKLLGTDRCIVTSDAMAAAGLGAGSYTIGRWKIRVDEDLAARSPDGSHLLGSAVSMKASAENLLAQLGLTDQQVYALTVENPKTLINSASANSIKG